MGSIMSIEPSYGLLNSMGPGVIVPPPQFLEALLLNNAKNRRNVRKDWDF